MIELLKRSFGREPNKIAYSTSSESVTYAQLWDDASKLAFKLKGNKKPVIVKGHKQAYMITAFVACNPFILGKPKSIITTFEGFLRNASKNSSADSNAPKTSIYGALDIT